MMKGKYIVFEGISGTGKETQAKRLMKFLTHQHKIVHVVYHPTPDLKQIIMTWRKERNIDSVTEAYFLLADRSDRVRQVIGPSLQRGEWVVSLRNYVSALVYQGNTRAEQTQIMHEFLRFEPKPDILFYFDIAPTVSRDRVLERHKKTGEPIGQFESQSELTKRLHKYHQILRTIPHVTLNAERTVDQIHKEIISRISILM
jgi:dTMP kinase